MSLPGVYLQVTRPKASPSLERAIVKSANIHDPVSFELLEAILGVGRVIDLDLSCEIKSPSIAKHISNQKPICPVLRP